MALVLVTSGNTAQSSGGAEQNVWPNGAAILGEFQFQLDLNLMVAGDVIEFRVYLMTDGTNSRVLYYTQLSGTQSSDAKMLVSEWVANTVTTNNAVYFGVKQLFGTGRALPFKVLNRLDFTTTPATANVTQWNSTNVSAPATAGIPDVNVKNIDNDAASASGTVTFPNATLASTTNITAGTITTVTNLTNAATAGDLTAAMKASVNAEVLDVLNVDTFAQPGQATPAATTSIRLMLNYLYKAWRNRTTQTASQYSLYNDDAVTVDQKGAFSDDGTTADRGEISTGP